MGVCSPIHVKQGSLKLKWLKITARAVKLLLYMRVSGISFQMGVRGLVVRVNLGVLDMKKFEPLL